jgi:hypothetical protein
MYKDVDGILDECIDRINRGESLEACLADYPESSEQLEPLLRAMLQTRGAYSFVPSASAKRKARQHFNLALEGLEQRHREKPSLFTGIFARPLAWATVATMLLVLITGYFGFRFWLYTPPPGPSPTGPVPSPVSPVPSPEGNFVFLISDEVNAIGDFESLNVSISKIGLLQGGDSPQWVEFEPEVEAVDLTLVPGDKTEEIWRGNVPEGQYTRVFIHVADVHGILKASGQSVAVKLPSQKLHLSKSFQVSTDTVTSFTYDLTVIAAGSPQSGIKYLLKPQIGQSGADHKPGKGQGRGRQR